MPWLHLHTEPNGDVLPCCDFNKQHPLANIKDTMLDRIVNGDSINSIRTQMLHGDYITGCEHCYKLEDNDIESLRTKSNELWSDTYDDLELRTNRDGSVNNFTLTSIDIGLSNVCNFKCRMCSGYHSSKIAVEEKEMYGREIDVLNLSERKKIFPQFMSVFDTIERVYFSGGEPLMMPEHYEVMEYLDKIQRYDVDIECNTNLSTLTYKGNSVIDYWKRFTNITLTLSIDGIGKHAEYLRHGTVWKQIEENYTLLLKECSHIRFRINSNINIYNAFNLMVMQHDWIIRGLITPEQINMKILVQPDYISIQVLPSTFKHKLTNQINDHIRFLHNYKSNILISQWCDVLKSLGSNDCSFKLDKFFKHTDELDVYRNESFEITHSEYSELRNSLN
jgi:MoaA/NifB/PqqE/SkfB family radical SAM enzyme